MLMQLHTNAMSGGGGCLGALLGVPPHCVEKWGTSVNIRAVQYFIVATEADMLLSPPPSPLQASSYLPDLITFLSYCQSQV